MAESGIIGLESPDATTSGINNQDNQNNWSNLKVRVISRAFYDDAYLDFFIKYYASLGFDTITILKADADIMTYKPPELPLSPITGNHPLIEIIPVKNEGNEIIRTHYNYYSDRAYDWILNIDSDEFLVIDLGLYPGGIKEYIYKLTARMVAEHKVPRPDVVQQIKFRWMCINKLNNRWPVSLGEDGQIINTDILADQSHQNIPSTTDSKSGIRPQSFAGYFLTHQLELYKFVKSMCNTKWANPKNRINAHFFNPVPYHGRTYNLLDGGFKGLNDSDPRYYPRDGSMLQDGYIIHINTRSLANAVTKCLVTKLRDNKKIKDPAYFKNLVNSFSPSTTDLQTVKKEFADQLNSKNFFPMKIRRFNSQAGKLIRRDRIITPLTSLINSPLTDLILRIPIVNEDLEWQILSDLCVANGINSENMRAIIGLF